MPLQPLTLSDLRRQLRLTKTEARKVQTIQKSHEHEPIPLRKLKVISITIQIRGMEFPRATALLDSGSDLNCIRKDLVPVNLWRKSGEQAKSAGGQRLDVSLQVHKVHVCYQRLCLLFDFVILDNLDYDLLLGTPFLSTISPFTSTKEGVHGNFNGEPVLLRFQPARMEGVDRAFAPYKDYCPATTRDCSPKNLRAAEGNLFRRLLE